MTYADIPADTVCTVTETVDGHTSTMAAEVTGDNGTPTTIPPGGTANGAITDTYTDISGQLVVNKIITGDGAGQQGPVTIHVACPASVPRLTPDFTIPAGDPSASHDLPGFAAGHAVHGDRDRRRCHQRRRRRPTTIDQPPPISACGSVEANVTDAYTVIGSLTVTKTIAGPAAGQQGP